MYIIAVGGEPLTKPSASLVATIRKTYDGLPVGEEEKDWNPPPLEPIKPKTTTKPKPKAKTPLKPKAKNPVGSVTLPMAKTPAKPGKSVATVDDGDTICEEVDEEAKGFQIDTRDSPMRARIDTSAPHIVRGNTWGALVSVLVPSI